MLLRTIGDVARAANVGVQTIRFYEREGLIAEPERTPSGYRAYDDDVITRLRFIRRSQELGFTLREIRELIALQDRSDADCGAVRAAASAKLSDIETRIADLQRMKTSLHGLMDSCSGLGPAARCEIIECLTAC